MLILRATEPTLSKDEQELRVWLQKEIGVEDEATISRMVWETHRAAGASYVDALAAIVIQTGKEGRAFIDRLLDFAKRPPDQREAEVELRAWLNDRLRRAGEKIRASRHTADAERAENAEVLADLRAFVWRAWPDKHRATIDGAVVSAVREVGGALTIDAGAIVRALSQPDPLAATAATSRLA